MTVSEAMSEAAVLSEGGKKKNGVAALRSRTPTQEPNAQRPRILYLYFQGSGTT